MPDITRDAKPKELEREMKDILTPLSVAVEAAGDLLRRYAFNDEKCLSMDVAEIVGCAVSESYERAANRLIEFACRADGNDAPARHVGREGV
jgi:hypothetical protein